MANTRPNTLANLEKAESNLIKTAVELVQFLKCESPDRFLKVANETLDKYNPYFSNRKPEIEVKLMDLTSTQANVKSVMEVTQAILTTGGYEGNSFNTLFLKKLINSFTSFSAENLNSLLFKDLLFLAFDGTLKLDEEITVQQKQLNALIQQTDIKQTELADLTQTNLQLTKYNEKLAQEITQKQELIVQLDSKIREKEAELKICNELFKQLQQLILEDTHTYSTLKQEVAALRSQLQKLTEDEFNKEKNLAKLVQDTSAIQQGLIEAQKTISTLKQEIKDKEAELDELEMQQKQNETLLENTQQELQVTKDALEEVNQEKAKEQARLDKIQHVLFHIDPKLQLKNLTDEDLKVVKKMTEQAVMTFTVERLEKKGTIEELVNLKGRTLEDVEKVILQSEIVLKKIKNDMGKQIQDLTEEKLVTNGNKVEIENLLKGRLAKHPDLKTNIKITKVSSNKNIQSDTHVTEVKTATIPFNQIKVKTGLNSDRYQNIANKLMLFHQENQTKSGASGEPAVTNKM